jgi:peroxiredoxin
MLAVGDKAPNFELPDQNGNLIKLSDLLGDQTLILFFTPAPTRPAAPPRPAVCATAAPTTKPPARG